MKCGFTSREPRNTPLSAASLTRRTISDVHIASGPRPTALLSKRDTQLHLSHPDLLITDYLDQSVQLISYLRYLISLLARLKQTSASRSFVCRAIVVLRLSVYDRAADVRDSADLGSSLSGKLPHLIGTQVPPAGGSILKAMYR